MKPIALAVLCMALAVWGCQPEDDFPEAPISQQLGAKTELLAGTWTLTDVTQYDEQLRLNGAPPADYINDLTNLNTVNAFGETQAASMTLVLNLADGAPSTYTATGSAAGIVPASGTWAVDHPVFTERLTLTGAGQTGAQTAVEIRLGRQVTDAPTLTIRVDRRLNNVLQSYILYTFTRNN